MSHTCPGCLRIERGVSDAGLHGPGCLVPALGDPAERVGVALVDRQPGMTTYTLTNDYGIKACVVVGIPGERVIREVTLAGHGVPDLEAKAGAAIDAYERWSAAH